ncbi:MAG TPA: hypothetical protein VMU08_08205, partial [Rhizomicrobium sp.]|nr:hypothetical protein [Rhizomicrobium sp.]
MNVQPIVNAETLSGLAGLLAVIADPERFASALAELTRIHGESQKALDSAAAAQRAADAALKEHGSAKAAADEASERVALAQFELNKRTQMLDVREAALEKRDLEARKQIEDAHAALAERELAVKAWEAEHATKDADLAQGQRDLAAGLAALEVKRRAVANIEADLQAKHAQLAAI